LNEFSIDAYGDSEGDKELLKIVDRPHYKSFEEKIKSYPSFSIKKLSSIISNNIFRL